MRQEVTTKFTELDGEPVVLIQIDLLPRGSGNRARAEALAADARVKLQPHVMKVENTSTTVYIWLRHSVQLMETVWKWGEDSRETRHVARA